MVVPQGRTTAHGKRAAGARTTRASARGQSSEPDIYGQMVNEELRATYDPYAEVSRPIKRRKVNRPGRSRTATLSPKPELVKHGEPQPESVTDEHTSMQEDVSDQDMDQSESSVSDSDVEFEDVDLAAPQPGTDGEDAGEDIVLELDAAKQTPSKVRSQHRLPSSREDREKRLNIHKAHLECLLSHVYIRDTWCNDKTVQRSLRPLLNKRVLAQLHKPESASQFERSLGLTEGLKQASEIWRAAFTINARGMHASTWISNAGTPRKRRRTDKLESPMTKADFLDAAQSRTGSPDTGAQLFTALLRSVGVDARVVCSLQVLPLAAAPGSSIAGPDEPISRNGKHSITEAEFRQQPETPTPAKRRRTPSPPSKTNALPKPIRRFNAPSHSTPSKRDLGTTPTLPTPIPSKPLNESAHPIYWTEAFNPAYQKWMPVDPLVTCTVAKPRGLEPPMSDPSNKMAYVVAFEEDGTVRDVTRRYARAFNAKTRKLRVESLDPLPNRATSSSSDSTLDARNAYAGREQTNARWWARCLRHYHGDLSSHRDEIEEAELSALEAAEPMPRSIANFKNHPFYALERHLRRDEVIYPRKAVGRIAVGKGHGGERVESVYRRENVVMCKSGDRWFRSAGRVVKDGEQPLKVVVPSAMSRQRQRERERSPNAADDGEEEEAAGTSLYAEFQTMPYIPPPVVDGVVPKNQFKNIDIYAPSMIPAGGVWVRAAEGVKAAKTLGVDYAEAVTGFSFKKEGKGRARGKAVTQGVVVAVEYRESMEEVIRGLRYMAEVDGAARTTKLALGLWRKFLIGLRVLQRVDAYREDGEEDVANVEDGHNDYEEEGGFLVEGNDLRTVDDPPDMHEPAEEDAAAAINDIDDWTAQEEARRARGCNDDVVMSIVSPWPLLKEQNGTRQSGNQAASTKGNDQDELFGEDAGGGGGFLPDADEDDRGGGGFVREEGETIDRLPNVDDTDGGGFSREEDGGGGFLADDDDDGGGGGFMVDDHGSGAFIPDADRDGAQRPHHDGGGGGLRANGASPQEDSNGVSKPLPEFASKELEKPTAKEHFMSGALQPNSQLKITATDSQRTADTAKTEDTHDMPTMQPDDQRRNESDKGSAEEDDSRSQSSMLSHDPDDEDAEPEWL